jgi:hypothetical protein
MSIVAFQMEVVRDAKCFSPASGVSSSMCWIHCVAQRPQII